VQLAKMLEGFKGKKHETTWRTAGSMKVSRRVFV